MRDCLIAVSIVVPIDQEIRGRERVRGEIIWLANC